MNISMLERETKRTFARKKYAVDVMVETEDKYILETHLFGSLRTANKFYIRSKANDNSKRNTEEPFLIWKGKGKCATI